MPFIRRPLRNLTAILIAVFLASAVGFSAASLNGIVTAKIGAWTIPGSTGAPTVVTWTGFTGSNNTRLSGANLEGGGSWVADIGTWTIQSNQAATNSVSLANMSVDVGSNSASAWATLTFGATARAGVMALDNGGVAIYALYSKGSGGTIQLYKYSGGQVLLATVTGVGTPTSAVMGLDATTNVMRVSWNGAVVLSYTLTASEVGTFKTGTNHRFGIIADSDSLTRFDNFHVDV